MKVLAVAGSGDRTAVARRLVERLESVFEQHDLDDGSFDRMEPARQFQENRRELSGELSKEQKRPFESLFVDFNQVLDSFESVPESSRGLVDRLLGI